MLLDSVELLKVGATGVVTKIFRDGVEVWPRGLPVLSSTSTIWDKVVLTWTAPAVGASNYVLKRGTTQIYSGTGLTFTDTLLMPETSYTYTLEAYKGAVKQSTATKVQTTVAHGDLGLTYSQLSYSYVLLSWTDTTQGSIDQYATYLNGVFQENSTSAADKSSGLGLAAGTAYTAEVRAYRAGVEIGPRDTVAFSSPARPMSSGSINGPAATTYGSWCRSSVYNLNGPTFDFSGRDVYVTSFNLLIWGYTTHTGAFDPHLDGIYLGSQTVTPLVNGVRVYAHVDGKKRHVGTSTTTGAKTGGNDAYWQEWDAYTLPQGQSWNDTLISVGTLNYDYYTSLAANVAALRLMPWWDESFLWKDIHIEEWMGDNGEIIATELTDKGTGTALASWRSVNVPAGFIPGPPVIPESPSDVGRDH